ncbi:hypothetical protein [Roseibacillus persicicus]|uniref:hypothetical protein n=1 Tax=Roseibacillus persicicus TaxID=454148 RepID=UPI00280D32B6|nr:hypothetical protein [Roseibacillus persicicus]MDQ8189276.1 hypothetical protein [Roseibacillus persicicus]
MKWPFALIILAPFSYGEVVDVTLTLTAATADENILDLGLSVSGIASDDTSEASGTVSARIDIAPESGEISTLELVTADVTTTGVSFVGTFIFATVYDLTTSDLGVTLDTPAPPAPVFDSLCAADFHELTINSGTLTGSSAVGEIPPQDFADTPVTGSGSPGDFIEISSTLNVELSTATEKVYDLNFVYPVAITQVIEVTEDFSATVAANGTVRAIGQVSLMTEPPNPYLEWAADNGDSDAPFVGNDFNIELENGLFWALGFEAGDAPRIFDREAAGAFALELPAGGTVAEVVVEVATDLDSVEPWTPLPSGQLSGAVNPIPAGTTGTLSIESVGEGRFYRLSAESPVE